MRSTHIITYINSVRLYTQLKWIALKLCFLLQAECFGVSPVVPRYTRYACQRDQTYAELQRHIPKVRLESKEGPELP